MWAGYKPDGLHSPTLGFAFPCTILLMFLQRKDLKVVESD